MFYKHLDLLSFKSIRAFAEDVTKTEDRLDILINNAGISNAHYLSEDGLNAALQINHFGPFLLTHLLTGNFFLVVYFSQRNKREVWV